MWAHNSTTHITKMESVLEVWMWKCIFKDIYAYLTNTTLTVGLDSWRWSLCCEVELVFSVSPLRLTHSEVFQRNMEENIMWVMWVKWKVSHFFFCVKWNVPVHRWLKSGCFILMFAIFVSKALEKKKNLIIQISACYNHCSLCFSGLWISDWQSESGIVIVFFSVWYCL